MSRRVHRAPKAPNTTPPAVVYDGAGLVAGRLSTTITKRLLAGDRVDVVNAERIVITGTRDRVVGEFRQKRSLGKIRKGPYYPRPPHMIFKRIVRGMLPFDQARGRDAHRLLRCHIGVPKALQGTKFERPETAVPGDPEQVVTLGEVSEALGFGMKEA